MLRRIEFQLTVIATKRNHVTFYSTNDVQDNERQSRQT